MEFSKVVSHPPGQVCPACANIVPPRARGETLFRSPLNRIDEYPSYPGIQATADAGCTLCRLISHAIAVMSSPSKPPERQFLPWYVRFADPVALRQKILAADWDRKVRITATFVVSEFCDRYAAELDSSAKADDQDGGMIFCMQLCFQPATAKVSCWEPFKWGFNELQFYVYDSLDLDSRRIQDRRVLPSLSTLSEANVARMKGWVNNCKENHAMCSINTDYWVPTRLVKITPVENTFRCQIIETENDDDLRHRDQTYAALSHVWGDISLSPPLRLFGSNYGRLKENINPSDLPRNFFDAAKVCLRLDIRYLWIDSLCIVQDSDADWRHEAAQMHLVYQYAVVTIAATQATSTHDGFLQRDIGEAPTCKIPYRSPAGNAEYMVLRWQEWHMAGHRLFAVNGSKWNTRCWTMQERGLSSRILHFCKNKVYFECRGALESEENEPPDKEELRTIPMWPQSGAIPADQLQAWWRFFVGQYSERNLTKSSDKLVAIQSIATRMASMTGQEYISFAGMWSENLDRELLWTARAGSPERCEPWRAPTWSWASLDGSVVLPEWTMNDKPRSLPTSLNQMLIRYPFEVIGHGRAGADLMGSPCGYLKLRALCIQVCRIQHRAGGGGKWGFYDVYSRTHDSAENIFAHAKLDVGTDDVPSDGSIIGPLLYMHVNVN